MVSTNSPRQRKRRRGVDAPQDEASSDNEREAGAKKRIRRRDNANTNGSPNNHQPGSSAAMKQRRRGKNAVGAGQNGNHSYEHHRPSESDKVSTANRTTDAIHREASAVSQVSLNLVHRKNTQPLCSSPVPAAAANAYNALNGSMHSEHDEDEDGFIHNTSNSGQMGRSYLRLVMMTCCMLNAFASLSLSAVFYTIDFSNKLSAMEKEAVYNTTIEQYETILEERNRSAHNHQDRAKLLSEQLTHSRRLYAQLQQEKSEMQSGHKTQIEEFKSIFKQHDADLTEALGRIKVLRGNKEDKSSALDMAWLRMDELMEENNHLSHHLNEAKKQQLMVLRDRELIKTVESLTLEYEQLVFAHNQITDLFLAPILSYVQSLQLTSSQQHSIILELTSLVHSLHSSLELSRSDVQIQSSESQNAIDAIATAAGQQAQRYEIEMLNYMEVMEQKLNQLEDEAFGAVQAVAQAAGKLEFERKIEEETRWKQYVEEVERTLGGIGLSTEHEILLHDQNSEPIGDSMESKYEYDSDVQGIIEKSVLRAAIGRKIEEGITSLRKYIHPYNHLKENNELYPWERTPEK